ncbi:dihydroxy-acid dehydratase [Sinosporangium siamense]|uniref:Dihydroxy-acid dehydratase n=1 Tax=Sinosporangium siamense TaxID=1367973 RepID=A0A919V9E3_9ACTN|nr:dihydroxy-acid dehydratase [Sinosporangium siamense]GII95206.1 dihydroxy-acid dehydratase [Sinosporangium siamense]
MNPGRELRSARWFGTVDISGFAHRTTLTPIGLSPEHFDGRPFIGIAQSWSDFAPCNVHFRQIAEHLKRGVAEAGGVAMEFPTISLGENLAKPTAMMFRNLMAMDVEESIRMYPMDAVVLLGGCDKTLPAQLMGAASVDLPTVVVTAGPTSPRSYGGRELGGGTDVWKLAERVRADTADRAEVGGLEAAIMSTPGHCAEMGSASTITALSEALGLALPGSATVPAMDGRRLAGAARAGRLAVELALAGGPTPAALLTREAFENAITLLMALGGSTNAIVHLLALAGRVGVPLTLDDFAAVSARTPLLANLRPSGEFLVQDLDAAGGVPAVLKELAPLLHTGVPTVTGRTLGEEIESAAVLDREVIAPLSRPRGRTGGLAVVRGSLAPDGAVIKTSAARADLLTHRGRAVVFEDVRDLAARIDDPALDVDESSVLVLRNSGPKGGPGMPEWGMLPIPVKLLAQGVTDMVRISDARMSGTAFGTVVLHVAPESAVGGPLALARDGDVVSLDVPNGRLDLEVAPEELERRRRESAPRAPRYRRGYKALFVRHVRQADTGCDFDFLRGRPDEGSDNVPDGILEGWHGGW